MALAPGGTAYPNEGNPWQTNWQTEYWAGNYPRLAELKAKYDPEGLFNCWRCVRFQDVWIHDKAAYH